LGRQDHDLGPERTRFPSTGCTTSTTRRWALHRRDRNPRFHRYDQLPASPHVGDLLHEVDRNPSAIVWASRHRPARGLSAARIHRRAAPL